MNKNINLDRFWSKVHKTDTCWLWTACKAVNGYGQFSSNRKTYKAHRISWELHFGEIEKNKNICHSCDIKLCVNPDHLFLGTQKENIHDMCKKNRQHRPTGVKNPKVKLTESQVLEIRELAKQKTNSIVKLSKKFNVCKSTINYIINRTYWKHI
jgi:hypothetical protein